MSGSLLSLLLVSVSMATATAAAPPKASVALDPHSYANIDAVRVKDLHLSLKADFSAKTLAGHADLSLVWQDPTSRMLILDTRDLEIGKVESISNHKAQSLAFALAPKDPVFGQKLSIQVSGPVAKVRIHYRTSPNASGLQWLAPEQTAGKKLPFMFSQSQAIHARSWVPIQDTPAVRFTYSADIKTPANLLARMSADNDPNDKRDGQYRFRMPQPIPSYLLAIAIGDLKFKAISKRSGVYAEPSVLDAAQREFIDTERMIKAAERRYGKYRWGRYDLLILPPSFPFGGMENPRLSFITPTIIAGDKSLVALIAHELAHSWSGNLVTNRSWDSFWLNEGFTSYVENRIVEDIYGRDQALMEQALSQDGLRAELGELAASDQKLRLDLRGRDPDEGLTAIAYDKGNWFLRFLEQRFGREMFDDFLRRYFAHFAFQSIGTDDFLAYLQRELVAKAPDKVSQEELRVWLEEPGIPAFAQAAESARFAQVDLALRALLHTQAKASALPAKDWTPQEWLRFLNSLPTDLDLEKMQALDAAWKLTASSNAEIAHAWFKLALTCGYRAVDKPLEQYLLHIGRRKLVLPLYEAMAKTEPGRERALAIYRQARPGYHPITQGSVDAALGWKAAPVAP